MVINNQVIKVESISLTEMTCECITIDLHKLIAFIKSMHLPPASPPDLKRTIRAFDLGDVPPKLTLLERSAMLYFAPAGRLCHGDGQHLFLYMLELLK